MPRRKHPEKPKWRKQIARTTRLWMISLISLFLSIALVFMLKVGEDGWSAWMIEYRLSIIGITLFITVILLRRGSSHH